MIGTVSNPDIRSSGTTSGTLPGATLPGGADARGAVPLSGPVTSLIVGRPAVDTDEWGGPSTAPVYSEVSAVPAGSVASPKSLGLRMVGFLDNVRRKVSEARDFSPFRVTLWRRGGGGAAAEALNAGLEGVEVPPGVYILTFKSAPGGTQYSTDVALPISVGGRSAVIEKVRSYADGRTIMQVRLSASPSQGGS